MITAGRKPKRKKVLEKTIEYGIYGSGSMISGNKGYLFGLSFLSTLRSFKSLYIHDNTNVANNKNFLGFFRIFEISPAPHNACPMKCVNYFIGAQPISLWQVIFIVPG